jgi:predicted transcriptional regulator
MCAQYLESAVDSIVIRDDQFKPIGIVGGYDLLDHLRKNPTRDFQYKTNVQQVMFTELPEIEKNTKLKDLIEFWKRTGRAFALIPNEYGDYSPVSARRMLDIGMRCKTAISISSMPRKEIITYKGEESLGQLLDLMYKNKTRKLLLENSDRYISDRLILGDISRMLNLESVVNDFLSVPVNKLQTEQVQTITEDIRFNRLCSLMDKMEHPYVRYKDTLVTPWDVCLMLLTKDLIAPLEPEYKEGAICPHCGKFY